MTVSRRRFLEAAVLGSASLASACRAPQSTERETGPFPTPGFELEEVSAADIRNGIASGRWRVDTVAARYLQRIRALDGQGPALRAVIRTNPDAVAARSRPDPTGAPQPLAGVPVLVKDNIETAGAMPTTAGSLALEDSFAGRDAFIVARLRAAGATILGKANLSEWANFRGARSTSGWSAVGGQCRNPYALDRNPCGSSSGSAVAVSANLALLALGTETDGSIVCPAAMNGVVGVKPTVGLVSRTGVIPIAASQDTAGPIARTVTDAARLLGVIAGPDPADGATLAADAVFHDDYVRFLDRDALRGARIGVARNFNAGAAVWSHFESALDGFRAAGATVVDPAAIPNADRLVEPEFIVLLHEFKDGIDRYLGTLSDDVPVHTLGELIAFNQAHADREMLYFGQERFRAASAAGPLTSPAYLDALAACRRLARAEGIDAVMDRFGLDALAAPTAGRPWLTDYARGDVGVGHASQPAAVAGYPHVTVPMGLDQGLPLGVSFFGRAWSEPTLLGLAYAYEQASRRREIPRFLPGAVR